MRGLSAYALRCSTDEPALKAARRIVAAVGGGRVDVQTLARVQVAVSDAILEWHGGRSRRFSAGKKETA